MRSKSGRSNASKAALNSDLVKTQIIRGVKHPAGDAQDVVDQQRVPHCAKDTIKNECSGVRTLLNKSRASLMRKMS